MTTCIECLHRNEESEKPQQIIFLAHKISFKQIVEVLFKCF